MATRTDITVDYFLSPRIIRVAAPSVELTIQDLHDTLTDIEQQPQNIVYTKLIVTEGKQPLGGSVVVGLTATLQNALVAFDARKTSASSGTVTSTDVTGRILTDSAGTLIIDAVLTGATIVNASDVAVASVVTVDLETQLTTDVLGDGTDNQFDSGDVYKIWNITQCSVTGGNLVAVDGVGSPLSSPILPTAGTQVVITASASATLQELLDIQHSSFNGGVMVKAGSGFSGVTYPIGTPRQPVDNIPDAVLIATERGFTTIFIQDDFTFDIGDILTDFRIAGENAALSTITINSGAVITNCEIREATVTGILDGGSTINLGHANNLTFVDGHIHDCIIGGTITLSGVANLHLVNCNSSGAVAAPIFDLANSGSALNIRGFDGELVLTNKSGSEEVNVDMNSGDVRITSTVTNGQVTVRGHGRVLDDATGLALEEGIINGGCTLIDQQMSGERQLLIERILRNKLITDPTTGIMTLYANDGTTVLLTAQLYEGAGTGQTYQGSGAERRERLQ